APPSSPVVGARPLGSSKDKGFAALASNVKSGGGIVLTLIAAASVQIRRGNAASSSSWRKRSPRSATAGAHDGSPQRARSQAPEDRGVSAAAESLEPSDGGVS